MSKNYIPSLYYQDQKVVDILGSRIITGYGDNTIEKFKDRLKEYIAYIKKDNEKILKRLYTKLLNKKSNDINYIEQKILELIEKAYKEDDNSLLLNLYDIFYNTTQNKIKLTEIDISGALFFLLTDFSKKKTLWYLLKEKYPKNEFESQKDYNFRLKKIIKELTELYKTDEEIISDMYTAGLNELFYKIALTFSKNRSEGIQNLLNNAEVDKKNIEIIIKYLKESGVDEKLVKKLQEFFYIMEEVKPTLTSQSREKIKGKNEKNLENIETTSRKIIADLNPFLIELNSEIGIKTLGYNRFIEVYEKIFSNIANQILERTKSYKPSFNKFLKFDTRKLNGKKQQNEKKTFVYQFIIEFNIENNFSIKDLRQIAVLLNEEIGDINLETPTIDKNFKHPLSTINSKKLKYDGYFSDSGEGFIDDNIVLIKGENGEQKLRLTLTNFSQDEYIYLISQIGHYLKYGYFIDKNQLYFNIYDSYNQTLFNENLFNIEILEDNYEKFVRNIVLPLSKEGIKIQLKPSNILLAGPYGTSKSQFLKHMLLNKKWKFKNKEFFLNATVIPLGLQEFKSLLLQGIGGIKTRLDQIFQRTSTPIVLLIEDLDTLISEKAFGVNDELAQAMTLFFEGLGSLPVNVITTSNDPTKFSERLIRPNRLSKILIFNRPTLEEKKQMLEEHLKIRNLKLSNKELEAIYSSDIFKEGTASHIGEIVKEIDNFLKIEKEIFQENIELTPELITKIIGNITISVKDLYKQEETISKWYKEVSGNIKGTEMGFLAKL